jgi:hypothetical protein
MPQPLGKNMPEYEGTRAIAGAVYSFDGQDFRSRALKPLWQDLNNTKNVRHKFNNSVRRDYFTVRPW